MTIIDVSEIQPARAPIAYGEYANLTPSQVQEVARQKLAQYIEKGRVRAASAIRTILSTEIRDGVLPVQQMGFGLDDQGRISMLMQGHQAHMARHAVDQAASRLGLPTKFVHEVEGQEWGRRLVAHNLTQLAQHADPKDVALVRAVDGQVRGLVSNAYKTDDSRPALDSLIQVVQEVGAVICDGDALDVRTSVKVVVAEPVELYPGEWCVFGLDYRNGDFGGYAREVNGFVLRLLCLNGCMMTSQFRRVHLGARIKDEVEYSSKTRRLNAEATASATRDMARHLLGPVAIDQMVQQVRAAQANRIDADQIAAVLKTRVNKTDEKEIARLFSSADVENLPAGQNRWRFSNAISWLAHEQAEPARRLDLEQLAGDVLAA
jgi:hypothetical protein